MSVQTGSLTKVADRLKARGLLQPGATLSQRLTGADSGQIAFLNVASDQSITVTFAAIDCAEIGGSSADSLLRQHLVLYRARSDVGAIVLNYQPWAGALRELGAGMPGIFDEQIRHLGTSVQLLPIQEITESQCDRLRHGENAFVLNKNVLILGMTLDRAVFNAELLEKCAKAFMLATSTGKAVGKIPWLVRYIANRRLMKDEKYAARQYVLGQVPEFKSAY